MDMASSIDIQAGRQAMAASAKVEARKVPLRLTAEDFASLQDVTGDELHCMDPWWIGRAQANSEHIAEKSLEREGFEVYYPKGRHISPMPRRKMSSKTRHKRRFQVYETTKPASMGYFFFRRLRGGFDIYRLFDLQGCSGLCVVGEMPAKIADFEIEILRLKEDRREFDVYSGVTPFRAFSAEMNTDPKLKEQWNLAPVTLGRVDESSRSVHFTKHLGRITRIIRSKTDIPAHLP